MVAFCDGMMIVAVENVSLRSLDEMDTGAVEHPFAFLPSDEAYVP